MMAPLWISYTNCKVLMHFLSVFSEKINFFVLKFRTVLPGSFYFPLIRLFPKLLSFCLISCVGPKCLDFSDISLIHILLDGSIVLFDFTT